MFYELAGKRPTLVAKPAFVADNATLVGDVELHENSSVWFGVVLRADNAKISIGKDSNVQDGTVIHVDPGCPAKIGEGVTIGHNAMIHGCSIGNNSLVGINAVVLNRSKVGENCLIGANALVPEGMEIPAGSMVIGSPAKIKRALSEPEIQMLKLSAHHYVENGKKYAEGLNPVEFETLLNEAGLS